MLSVSDNDLRIGRDGSGLELALGPGVTTVEYELTIEGASSVTVKVSDQARALFTSGLLDADEDGRLDQQVVLSLGNDLYELAALSKQADEFTLTFEDQTCAKLRRARGQLKPGKGEGHVRFAKRLATAVGAEFVTPTGAPTTTPSRSVSKQKAARAASDARREKGVADGARLTVKGSPATAEQKRNMNTVLAVCAQENAGEKATLACVLGCIVESTFRNLGGGDRDSVGILQVRVGLHGADVARSVERSVRKFLNEGFAGAGGAKKVARDSPNLSPGQVAATVLAPAAQYRARYDQYAAEGRKIVAAYGGGAGSSVSSSGGSSSGGRSPVQRGTPEKPRESSWEALQRIAGERGYRCFVLRNTVYYGREQDFIRSRPRMVLSEQTPGVDWIDGDWIPNARVNIATVTGRAGLWDAPPGSCVTLEDVGPLSGRWLVRSFRRSRYDVDATIELARGTELLKPQPIVRTSSGGLPALTTFAGAENASSTVPVQGGPAGTLTGVTLDSRWAGCQSVFDQFIHPFMRRHGLSPGSQKRPTMNTANGNVSDHWTGARSAYATDYPTRSGAQAATALARAMGQANWRPGTYARFTITAGGKRFTVQILWAVPDHYDHIHVGLRAL